MQILVALGKAHGCSVSRNTMRASIGYSMVPDEDLSTSTRNGNLGGPKFSSSSLTNGSR